MKKQLDKCISPDIAARPYQLMCILCRLGAGDPVNRLRDQRLDALFQAIRKNPRRPVRLAAYDGDRYTGADADSPRGVIYHLYQDFKIEAKYRIYMNRAQSGLGRLLDIAEFITGTEDVCWFDPQASVAWRGCPLAGQGYYARGRERLNQLAAEWLPAFNTTKSKEARDRIKAQSAVAILKSDVIRLFPNHLLYVVGTYLQYDLAEDRPLDHDNLWEPAEAMRRNPEIPVMLVPDYCMVCPPCTGYDLEGSGLCRINPLRMKPVEKIKAMGGLVAVSILKSLGVEYFEKLPAWKMLERAKERLTADHIAFTYSGAPPSYYTFARSLRDGLGFLEAYRNPRAVIRRVGSLMADRRAARLLPAPEKAQAGRILTQAKDHLAHGRQRDAYLALTDSAFVHTWKQYLELIPKGYARLPKDVQTELSPATTERVLKAQAAGRRAAQAPYAAGFVTMVSRPAIAETGLRVSYDKQNLYVDWVCADIEPRKLKADARVGTDLKQTEQRRYDWRHTDDTVLLVLQPDPKSKDYFNFIVNPRGVKLGDRRVHHDGKQTTEWVGELDWRADTQVTAFGWRAKLTIPFSVLGSGESMARRWQGLKSVRGARWRMNAHRFFRNDLLDPHSWVYARRSIDDMTQTGWLAFA